MGINEIYDLLKKYREHRCTRKRKSGLPGGTSNLMTTSRIYRKFLKVN
ncbi:MAG: hypothetical protein ACLU4N_01315 [Butyricimonas faecihominis]